LLQEGSAQSGKTEPRLFFQSVQHTTNTVVNFNEGLSFPPPDHIHALEKYAPGFVAAVVLLFLDHVPAGIACLGAYSLSHIPAMLESMRSRKKK
jgi:hypothetical protein